MTTLRDILRDFVSGVVVNNQLDYPAMADTQDIKAEALGLVRRLLVDTYLDKLLEEMLGKMESEQIKDLDEFVDEYLQEAQERIFS